MSDEKKSKWNVWYKEGLKFGCTGCGRCCSKEPGFVWLEQDDIETLAKHHGLTEKEFLMKYARYVFSRYSLREMPVTYDCVFLKNNQCSVYTARPKQCRKFPFWSENIASKEAWEEAALSCEGINHKDAPLIPAEEIARRESE